jgi:hypothetical protein
MHVLIVKTLLQYNIGKTTLKQTNQISHHKVSSYHSTLSLKNIAWTTT